MYEKDRYVYKGANPNNYITFNNETWRIISVESDGTIKIIKDEMLFTKVFDSRGLRDIDSNGAGGTYCANNYAGCNAWAVTENFTNGDVSGSVLKNAEINDYLNGEYFNNLDVNSQKQIVTYSWNVGGIEKSNDDLVQQIKDKNLLYGKAKLD